MNEKTETKSLEEITESQSKTAASVEEITDYYAKKWYKEGFRFAINYIYAHMLKTRGQGIIDPEAYKAYVKDALDIGVEEDYFVKRPFSDGNYPSGQCPGDSPGTCIQCADRGVKPIDTISIKR